MARTRERLRGVRAWLLTLCGAAALAVAVSGGVNVVRPENRPLAQLAGRVVATGSPVTSAGLLGKPAIINVWSPG